MMGSYQRNADCSFTLSKRSRLEETKSITHDIDSFPIFSSSKH